MNKDFIKGVNFGLGIFFSLSILFGIVFAVGFHSASEIVSGIFQGNYTFNGTLNSTNEICITSGNCLNDSITSDILIFSPASATPSSSVKLLIQTDGADNSNTFLDKSQYSKTITASGNVHHETSDYKFGTSSIYFDGTTDYLSIANDADFDFGTGDFTIDFWMKTGTYGLENSATRRLFMRGTHGGSDCLQLALESTSNKYLCVGSTFYYLGTTTLLDNNWHHVALVRSSGIVSVYVDGTYITGGSNSINIDSSAPLYIGVYTTTSGSYQGYINDFSITNTAKWTSSFTPPTSSYYSDARLDYNYNGTNYTLTLN